EELGPLAVLLTNRLWFLRDVEGIAGLRRRDHLHRLSSEGVNPRHGSAGIVDFAANRVEGAEQFAAIVDAIERQILRGTEVHRLRAGDVRLVRFAEESGLTDVIGIAEVDIRRQRSADAGVLSKSAHNGTDGRTIPAQEASEQLRRRVALLLELHIAND